jgi:HSP20 family protein
LREPGLRAENFSIASRRGAGLCQINRSSGAGRKADPLILISLNLYWKQGGGPVRRPSPSLADAVFNRNPSCINEENIMANKLTRFDPFTDLARFERPFGGLQELFEQFGMQPFGRGGQSMPSIRMDVSETPEAYMVKADIPGMKKEDIKVSIEGNQVSISAESRSEKEEKEGETVVRSERSYGRQSRSFTLGSEIDDAKANARYENGVLELTLPKRGSGSGAKQLPIS